MHQVIARKYRPRNFDELIGQEHVRTTLENAIAQRRIAHGYIFSGQRGTGKTTVARIMARALNCIQGPTIRPCGECASCREVTAGSTVDVIEIDAASNRGINEMRELRESVRYQPARDRYKIFIIDEAHQITSEAFNALLKTLEEPPEWVVFILRTTESHKIPNTIASRCQQFSFRSVDFDLVMERLRLICREEGIEADDETLAAITLAGEGSVRDSLSALDQAIACCGNTLHVDDVRQLLGRFSLQTLEKVAEALLAADAAQMLDIVNELERSGSSLHHFSRETSRFFRNLLVTKLAGPATRLVAASSAERDRMAAVAARFSEEDLTRYLQISLDVYNDLQYSLQPRMHLELGLVRMVHAGRLESLEKVIARLGSGGGTTPQAPPSEAAPKATPPKSAPVTQAAPLTPAPAPAGDFRSRLLNALREQRMTHIADAVEASELIEKPGEVVFRCHKAHHLSIRSGDLRAVAEKVAGRPLKVTAEISAANAPQPATASQPDDITRYALENPEVQRYKELFPNSEVRAVRNLRE